MSNFLMDLLLVLGVALVGMFLTAGLASPRFRAALQRPAEDMLQRDRRQWGEHPGRENGAR
ncbi:hypothetical protein ACFSL4_15530 [Streptomyces caeni]|uniref:Type II secretion system F family protein n=1 Tax=Streptomyces caeni TaxID=2307231 RepID=A0ABW4IS60_9ACTN